MKSGPPWSSALVSEPAGSPVLGSWPAGSLLAGSLALGSEPFGLPALGSKPGALALKNAVQPGSALHQPGRRLCRHLIPGMAVLHICLVHRVRAHGVLA